MSELLSIILPSRNNLQYLKWAYDSIRKNLNPEHQICIHDDRSTDGTWEWLKELKKTDEHITISQTTALHRQGLTRLYDKLIREHAIHDNLFVLHADMYVGKHLDTHILKYLKEGTVVCATRVEPPLHPPGVEKIIKPYGLEPDEFNEAEFNIFVERMQSEPEKITHGVFAPWAIKRSDFERVGGHDELFAPQSREDSDLFNRLSLAGMEFIQTWQGLVYHLTSRGSRFNPNYTQVGVDSDEWKRTNARNMKNFIRKWGSHVNHDAYMKPIVTPKYDISLVVDNITPQHVIQLEPYCTRIYTDLSELDVDKISRTLQEDTPFIIKERVFPLSKRYTEDNPYHTPGDVIVSFDASHMTHDRFMFIMQLPQILSDSGEVGEMEYDIFKIDIQNLNTYEKEMMVTGKEYYRDMYLEHVIRNWH